LSLTVGRRLGVPRRDNVHDGEKLDSGPHATELFVACSSTDSSVGGWGSKHSLLRIAGAVSNPEETLGVLVHGSFATGAQTLGSDIDLICVTKTSDFERHVEQVEGFEVDLCSGSRLSIQKQICSRLYTNNNSVLHAFAKGRPLLDVDGSLAGLAYEARQIWSKGPTHPTNEELDRLKTAARSASTEAARLAIRATRSAEWQEIASVRSSILFVDSVHNYCRTHGLWASAIWELLKWNDPQYGFLQTVIRGYLRAPSLANRLQAIRDLSEAVLSKRLV
jgi:predicted nucleotidyltransferase